MIANNVFRRMRLQLPCPHSYASLCRCSSRLFSDSHTIADETKESSKDSIFSTASPWDKVFENIDENLPPLSPASARGPKNQTTFSARSPRRTTMTAREINAFDQMFNMIFNAVSKSSTRDPNRPAFELRPLAPTVGIGRARSPEMSDLFGRLRRQSRHLRWTSGTDEELDKKKEAMELCETDQQLLEWAMREVFDESRRYEENARKALENPSDSESPVQLQPPTYPHLLALLIRTFRDKYTDPHLALSIFEHARHLSIASFVFGCTTPAYNELIETRWRCFRDLRGVCDALEEMRVNGVETDNGTQRLVEVIRREVGVRNLWQEETTIGSSEVWDMIARMERLIARPPTKGRHVGGKSRPKSWAPAKEKQWSSVNQVWKRSALQEDDGWEFDQWEQHAPTTR